MSEDFPTTPWHLVMKTRDSHSEIVSQAMEELWEIYRTPLLSALRSYCPAYLDPEDVLHEFYRKNIQNGVFHRADPTKGKTLRGYLRVALKHHLLKEIRFEGQEKRSRDKTVSLEALPEAASSEMGVLFDSDDLYQQIDLEWAKHVSEIARQSVRSSFERRGKADYFDRLMNLITHPDQEGHVIQSVAEDFEKSLGSVRTDRTRLRKLYAAELLREIGRTVYSENESKAEFTYLLKVLKRGRFFPGEPSDD